MEDSMARVQSKGKHEIHDTEIERLLDEVEEAEQKRITMQKKLDEQQSQYSDMMRSAIDEAGEDEEDRRLK